jgi:hypothetical protein
MQCSLLTHCCAKEVVTLGPGLGLVLEVLVLVLVFEVEVSGLALNRHLVLHYKLQLCTIKA